MVKSQLSLKYNTIFSNIIVIINLKNIIGIHFYFAFPFILTFKYIVYLVSTFVCFYIASVAGVKETFVYIFFAGLVGIVGVKAYIRLYRKQKLLKSGIHEIDSMNGSDFEKYLEVFFQKKGYRFERTPISGDFGADLIIMNSKIRRAVQAKRYSDRVGLTAVQEVVGAMAHYSCQSGMVITNNYFTQQAKKLAASNNIILWEREDLIKELLSIHNNRIQPEKAI